MLSNILRVVWKIFYLIQRHTHRPFFPSGLRPHIPRCLGVRGLNWIPSTCVTHYGFTFWLCQFEGVSLVRVTPKIFLPNKGNKRNYNSGSFHLSKNFWMKSVLCIFFAVYHSELWHLSQILIHFKIFMFNVWKRNWPGRHILQKMDLEKSLM